MKESFQPTPIPPPVPALQSKQPQLQRSLSDMFSNADINAAALATLAVSGNLKVTESTRIITRSFNFS